MDRAVEYEEDYKENHARVSLLLFFTALCTTFTCKSHMLVKVF